MLSRISVAVLALVLVGCVQRQGDEVSAGPRTEPAGPEALHLDELPPDPADPSAAPPPVSGRDRYWRYTPPASVKMSVREIQRTVGVPPDGDYGPATKEAVKRYQQRLKKAGLYKGPADGIWGPATERAATAKSRGR